jgi:WD40 repeat protein
MGGHYGSIHIRTDAANSVLAAVSELAREDQVKFLVAPAINGWISVFPEHNGQNPKISEDLATRLQDLELIHCLVHDDDVFAYWYFEKGTLKDRYNSCPTYFSDKNPEPRGGIAHALGHLLAKPDEITKLQKLLDTDRFDFEMERFDQFAAILGLPNAVSAYEYLQNGERNGIKQWKQFVHVPDLTAELAAKRAAKAKAKAEMKRLAAEGLLIMELVGAKTKHPLFPKSPIWSIDPKTNDVLLMWSDNPMAAAEPAPLLRVDVHTGKQETTGVNPSDHTNSLAVNSSGRWLAAGGASGDWKTQVWDLAAARIAVELPQSRASGGLCFSPDGHTLFSLSEQTITMASGSDLNTIETIQVSEHGRALAIHPRGEYLVVASQGILAIVHIPTQAELKTMWVDARPGLERTILEQFAPQATSQFLETLSPHIPPTEMAQRRIRMQQDFIPKQSVFALTFSPDGELLICGTNAGVCVFDWRAVLGNPAMSPLTPKMFVEAEEAESGDKDSPSGKLIYSVIYDSVCRRVLFAGLEGKVRFLELAEGLTGDLLVPPIRLPFWQLELTPDRTALVGTAIKITTRKPEPQKFQIWNYPALCRSAGIPF